MPPELPSEALAALLSSHGQHPVLLDDEGRLAVVWLREEMPGPEEQRLAAACHAATRSRVLVLA